MNHKQNTPVLLLLIIIAFILAACGGSHEVSVVTATPASTDVVVPTAVVEVPATAIATEDAATATTEATATTVVDEATATSVPATATAVPAPTEPSRPQSLVQRINFPAGATSDSVSGRVGAGQRDVYLFRALAGQASSLSLTSPGNSANFTLSGLDDGLFHKGASDPARQWSGTLPLTQDYIVVVTAPGTVNYSLHLAISPLPATGSIRGLVFVDTERDDSPDDDEPVEGAPVTLSGGVECQTQLAETSTTAVGGAYAFYDLAAGSYCVTVSTAEVTVSALVELGAGEDAVDVNLSWPGPPLLGSISGLAFEDANRNDHADEGEPVADTSIRLLGGAECSTQLAATTTTATGAYAFSGIPSGSYCVQVVTTAVTVGVLVELGAGEEAVDINLSWPGSAPAGSIGGLVSR